MNPIKRELLAFLMVGMLTALINYFVYRSFLILIGIDLSKAAGFIVGMIFGYFANRTWTFSYTEKNIGNVFRFVVLYAISLCLDISTNRMALHFSDGWEIRNTSIEIYFAFFVATGASVFFNFIGMKWFVFRKRKTDWRNRNVTN